MVSFVPPGTPIFTYATLPLLRWLNMVIMADRRNNIGQMRNGGQSEKLYGKCETRMEHAIRHFHYETDGKQDRIAELKAQRKTMDKQLEDMRSRRGKPTT